MLKNTAGQKWRVFAFNRTTNVPVTGDGPNITAKLSMDYGSRTATSDVNPTEAEDGYYYFEMAQAETNPAHIVEIFPESSTANVQVIGVPAREIPTSTTSSGGSGGSGGISLGAGFPTDDYLIRYLSENGIISFGDHDEDGAADTGVLDDCKQFGSSQTAGRLAKRYTYAMLLTAPMMSEVFAVATLRRYCMRRGNGVPASLEAAYQEFFAKDGLVDQIADGTIPLTDVNGNPLRPKNANAPGWANLHVDRWYPESKIRVISGNSDMSPSKLSRKVDRFPESFG
jgi:hypothetical protein